VNRSAGIQRDDIPEIRPLSILSDASIATAIEEFR
jgi:hypothetical protein